MKSLLLTLLVLLGGCSAATVTELYLRTPARSTSVGPGVQTETHVKQEAPRPFLHPAGQEVSDER